MNAVDTSVLIYCCDQRDPGKQQRALTLVESMRDGLIPWQVACEFVAASRKLGPQGFTADQAWARLGELLRILPLALPSAAALALARDLHLRVRLSFWDAMILASCLEAGVTRIYSEDLPGGQAPGIEIVNPFL